jgi:WD40 repeat protein
MEKESYNYKAFISYSHKDEKWGRWLHRGIEGYRIPKGLVGRDTLYGPVPKRLFPLFRDREELPTASDLSQIIDQALIDSSHLIVICSPNSAKSQWVNEEVKAFKKLGKQNRILCLIVDGEPNAESKPELGLEECFPPAVKVAADEEGNLTDIQAEPIAADAREGKDGKANAMMKVLAGLLGVGFDEIKQRDLVRKQKRAAMMVAASLCLALVMGVMTAWAIGNSREAERQREVAVKARTVSDEQRGIAEKARDQARQLLYNVKIQSAQNYINLKQYFVAIKALDEAPLEFRNFEWGYLIKKANPQQVNLHGHSERVNTANFSPDGKRIVTASDDRTAKVWNAETGDELTILEGHSESIIAANFSPDGKRIVTVSGDRTARIWNAETGDELTILEGHNDWVSAANFSSDGKRIVTASGDRTARIWNAETGDELTILEGHSERVNTANFSPDGKRIVTASDDRTARIWNAETGDEFTILEGHNDWVSAANFSSDGKRIVTASGDRTAKIWNAETGNELTILGGHSEGVIVANFSPDGKRIVTASLDRTARIWNAETGDELTILEGHSGWVVANFSPDGKRIVTASEDRTARIWNAETGDELTILEGHSESIIAANFSPDGKRIVTASDDRTAKVWNAETGDELTILEGHSEGVGTANFSSDGKRIVTASGDRTAKVWNAETGEELTILGGHSEGVRAANFSPDGKRIVTASGDRTARIWNAETGDELTILEGHSEGVNTANFSPDGKRIVTASLDRTARIWNAETGDVLTILEGHSERVNTANFSSDGKRIVTASWDRTAKIWNAAPWNPDDYPGDKTMPFTRRYNLWSIHEYKRKLSSGNKKNGTIDAFLDSVSDISLSNAVRLKDAEAVKKCLADGMDVNVRNSSGKTPLEVTDDYEIAGLLIDAGANINLIDINQIKSDGLTFLHQASDLGRNESVISFLKSGANINIGNEEHDDTPLMYTVLGNRPETARLLMEKGAEVNMVNKYNMTALDFALNEKRGKSFIDLLRKHGAKTKKELEAAGKPTEPVAEAAQPEPPTAEAPDISIHLAAGTGNIEAVKQHLDAGTDVNAKDDGWTPLHNATGEGRKEIVELLLTNGADVNAKADTSGTPLHYAAIRGYKEIAELLITKGAEVNAKMKSVGLYYTPLDLALLLPETADLLRKHGGKTAKELKAEGK